MTVAENRLNVWCLDSESGRRTELHRIGMQMEKEGENGNMKKKTMDI
jgi:hypothetical protein